MVRARTAIGDTELSTLLSALVGAGLKIVQFREVQTDLEDAFLTVSRDDAVGQAA